MDESHVKTNSPKAWLLASRPKTLTGAAVPVMIGAAMAYADAGQIEWLPCLLCLLFAFVMQIDANFVNDYFDYRRGNDDAATRLGPARACSMGWVTPGAMRWALGITTSAACVIGLPLAWIGGWTMIAVGAACVLFCFLYTTSLSYLGLGDLLVLVFFGLVPVCLTYYLSLPEAARTLPPAAVFTMSAACGLAIDTLLVVNNYRDIDNDRRDGKHTLIVLIGKLWGRRLYLGLGLAAVILAIVSVSVDQWLVPALLIAVYGSCHVSAYRELRRIDHGRELNKVLGGTARNIFLFGLCIAIGLIVSTVL